MPDAKDAWTSDMVERLVAGRYRLVEQLGAGGMGTVWRAHDVELRVDRALKEITGLDEMSDTGRRELLERARREARHAAKLGAHPGVVAVHDLVVHDGRPWIVMELVPSRTLAEILRTSAPLPVPTCARIGLAVLDALAFAHSLGVVHRDVKPGNVLITSDGRVKLSDFGIASHEGDSPLTRTGLPVGTPEFMAPERIRGAAAEPAGDLFSLGALLYSAVEGVSAFRRESTVATIHAVVFEPMPAPHRAGALGPVLAGLLEKDPGRRMTAQAVEPLLRAAVIAPDTDSADRPAAPGMAGPGAVTGLVVQTPPRNDGWPTVMRTPAPGQTPAAATAFVGGPAGRPPNAAEGNAAEAGLERLIPDPADPAVGPAKPKPGGHVVGRRALLAAALGAATVGVGSAVAVALTRSTGGGSPERPGPAPVASRTTTPAPPGSLGPVTIALASSRVESVGTYLAHRRGYYTAEGFTGVTWLWGRPQDLVPTGEALAGVDAVDVVARRVLQGSNTRVVGARYQRYPWGVVSRADRPITSVEDLLGKRVALSEGAQHIWRAFLRSNGVAESSVTSIVTGDGAAPLRTGDVDGAVSFVSDLPVRMRSDGVEVTMLLFNDHSYPLVHGVYLTSTENLTSRRTELKAMLAAEIQGWTDALADPATAAQLSATVYSREQDNREQDPDPQAELADLVELVPLVTSAETRRNGLFTISEDRAAGTVSSINTDNAVLGNGLPPITVDGLFDLSLLAELYAERPDLPR